MSTELKYPTAEQCEIEELETKLENVTNLCLSRLRTAMHSLEGTKNMHGVYNDNDSLTNYKLSYNTAMVLHNICHDVLGLQIPRYTEVLNGHISYLSTPVSEW